MKTIHTYIFLNGKEGIWVTEPKGSPTRPPALYSVKGRGERWRKPICVFSPQRGLGENDGGFK